MTHENTAPERIWAVRYPAEYYCEPPVNPEDMRFLTEYVRADLSPAVTVKPLEWSAWALGFHIVFNTGGVPNREFMASAKTSIGKYSLLRGISENGWFFARVTSFGGTGPFESDVAAKVAAQKDYENRIRLAFTPTPPAAPEPTVQEAKAEILKHTFAVQHNPNCPSPWLVRLPGKSCVIDLKPYYGVGETDFTDDALGFGKTFEEAASNALTEQGGE